MNLFQLGDFTLNSGAKSKWKLECDALSDGDIAALAEMIRQMVGPYSSVEGIPRGGLRLADTLRSFASAAGPHLLVDDVLTTGGSLERARKTRWEATRIPDGPVERCVGAVVFARGQCPIWVKAVFQMPEVFWLVGRKR